MNGDFVPKIDTSNNTTMRKTLIMGKLTKEQIERIKDSCKLPLRSDCRIYGYSYMNANNGIIEWRYDQTKVRKAIKNELLPTLMEAHGDTFNDFIQGKIDVTQYEKLIDELVNMNIKTSESVKEFLNPERNRDGEEDMDACLASMLVPVIQREERIQSR